ncbi:hypothetical protein ABM90_26970 [Rhodococcus erythropolis]|nr:hypothetical protein ABM90_26970 [Rhodococcus erythropolis]
MIGWAEDADVSGAVDPFDTPQLGRWLNQRIEEYDVIAAWKFDRRHSRPPRGIGWRGRDDREHSPVTQQQV